VIELALGTLKGSAAANLKLELYGREFTVFASDLTRDLAQHRQKEQQAAAEAKSSKDSSKDEKGKKESAAAGAAALPPVSARPTLAAMLVVRPERADATLTQVGMSWLVFWFNCVYSWISATRFRRRIHKLSRWLYYEYLYYLLIVMLTLTRLRVRSVSLQVGAVVGKLVRKGLLAFQYAHELVAEYLETCPAKQVRKYYSSIPIALPATERHLYE
jgi:hypothetical protein